MKKAHIVANKEQEHAVLDELYKRSYLWNTNNHKHRSPSERFNVRFPYVIYVYDNSKHLKFGHIENIPSYAEIVYDGRKESKMKISKEVYDALMEWRDDYGLYASSGRHSGYINGNNLFDLPEVVQKWRVDIKAPISTNNRLIAIIRWVNGEDMFEVEKPKKWVVRSKETDKDNEHCYILRFNTWGIEDVVTRYDIENATKFDTKEEAESWANAHQEVIEVEA